MLLLSLYLFLMHYHYGSPPIMTTPIDSIEQQSISLEKNAFYGVLNKQWDALERSNFSQPGKRVDDTILVDLMHDLYGKSHRTLKFIQIGAANGDWKTTNDPIQKHAFTAPFWKGVLVEPVPMLFEGLTKNMNLTGLLDERIAFLNVAIGKQQGTQTFYRCNLTKLRDELLVSGGMWERLGSFDREHIVKHLVQQTSIPNRTASLDYVIEIEVKTLTAKAILSASKLQMEDVDLFIVDAEGFDFETLKAFFQGNEMFRPWLAIYENYHLTHENDKADALAMMQSFGYKTYPSGLNTVCVLQ